MDIFVGLGNPGEKHKNNRHNVGFLVLDSLARETDGDFSFNKIFNSDIFKKENALFAKPQTFMNLSGEAVRALEREYKDSRIVIIYDDVDIPLGEVKCSFDRGSGGHNGLQSVIDSIGSKFFRIRIGVRPAHEELLNKISPPDGYEKFLLSNFTEIEKQKLEEGIEKAKKIVVDLQNISFEKVMNKWN